MDIYQIWTKYNKQWTKHEILIFSIILIFTITISIICIIKKKVYVIQGIAAVILIGFLGIVFGSTVFTRPVTVRQYELIPFWSWKTVICYLDKELLKENLLNCILLFPVGMLLPEIVMRKVKWYQALLVGILISTTIEVSQLLFMCGLFEWDDIIHNGLGCMVGSLLMNNLFEKR